jgi:release factor glutamine methyltransferase
MSLHSSFESAASGESASGSTVRVVRQDAIAWLRAQNVPEPEASAYHLLASALDLDWSDGFLQVQRNDDTATSNRRVTSQEWDAFQTMLHRRATMEPLQYILGQWDFLDYTFYMRAPLLCPRPETEELVLHVERSIKHYVQDVKPEGMQQLRILDVGCGTGAIGISLCHRLGVLVDAIDVEPIAIEVSNQNAERILGPTQKAYYRAELCDIATYDDSRGYDMVVSNPPYIPRCDMETLTADVVNFESDTALCGGNDGLDVVRVIIDKLPILCRPGALCWMEVDPSHPTLIQDMLRDNTKVAYHSSYKDLFGKERFVKLVVR